jgi:hypothetical protein
MYNNPAPDHGCRIIHRSTAMRTKLIIGLMALLVIFGILLAACGEAILPVTEAVLAETAILSEVQGAVQLRNPQEADFTSAGDGDTLQVQGQVRTGQDGRVRLDLATGTVIRVAPDSLFTLESNQQEDGSLFTRLLMGAGQVWVILNGGQLEIQTPSGTASVRGSFMSVWVDPETSDVWVTCLEGWCAAENPTAALDMVAGQGAMLYNFEPNGAVPPPPPAMRYLTQQDIDNFLANNPEAQEIMNAVVATASALPTLVPSSTPTPVGSCFTQTSPADGAMLDAQGVYNFTWTEQPGRYKYVITFIKPNGGEISRLAWTNSYEIGFAELLQEGAYQWRVTAYDASIQPICTAGPFTFTKAASPTPTQGSCFELTSPADGTTLPATGPVTFTWSEQPGRYKYILTITKPDGSEFSRIVWTNSYTIQAEAMTEGGTYTWQVAAYDLSIKPICTAGPRTFTKLGAPTATPGGTGCSSLLSPANGASLGLSGPVTFSWTAYPGAYKYIINFKTPVGTIYSFGELGTSHVRNMDALPQGGAYEWWVTVKGSNLAEICSSEHFTFTKAQVTNPTATPTPGGGGCTSLLAPSNGANLPATGPVTFTWESYPGALKYIVNLKAPNGTVASFVETGTSHTRFMDSLTQGGTYVWWVTVKDGSLTEVCSSERFTFSKPAVTVPTDTPGVSTFWNQSGPTGNISSCLLAFSVDTNAPASAMVKLIFSSNPVPDGNIDAHVVMTSGGGTKYSTGFKLDDFGSVPSGTTIYWRFAVYDGAYTHDSNVYSFVSPGCPPQPPPDSPTVFSNPSGPAADSSTCSNYFQVDATDADGLQFVKIQFKIVDASGTPVSVDAYEMLDLLGGSTYGRNISMQMAINYTVSYWFWAIDINGNTATYGGWSFIYTGPNTCP